eukprot:evm.model.scf_168.4 EVM.evm.TU.scf_168.4   scf_168:25366-26185(-)
MPTHPAYCKYRTRQANQAALLKEWRILQGGQRHTMTAWTAIAFVPVWLKFYMVPLPIKYVTYLVWWSLRTHLLYPAQKAWARVDVKMDAFLARVGSKSAHSTFSLGMALARLHGHVNPWQDLCYRFRLLRTGDTSCWRSYYTKAQEIDDDFTLEEEEELLDDGSWIPLNMGLEPQPDPLEGEYAWELAQELSGTSWEEQTPVLQ